MLTGEDKVQAEVIGRLRFAGYLCWHTPNEGKRKVQYGAKLKQLGVLAGVPDVIIATPPPDHPGPAAALELKSATGRKPTPAQQTMLDALAAEGWATGWAKGTDAALEVLRGWGYLV